MVAIMNHSTMPTKIDHSEPNHEPIDHEYKSQNNEYDEKTVNYGIKINSPSKFIKLLRESFESYCEWKKFKDIRQVLKSAKVLSDLCPLVEKAEVHLSFWGKRYITVKKYDNTLSFENISERINSLLNECDCLSKKDVYLSEYLIKKIKCLNEKSIKQFEKANCFTRQLSLIRNDLTFFD